MSEEHILLLSPHIYIYKSPSMPVEQIIIGFKQWSEDKASRFSDYEIMQGIEKLQNDGLIKKDMVGYSLVQH